MDNDLTTGWKSAKEKGEAQAVAAAKKLWKQEASLALIACTCELQTLTTADVYARMARSIRDLSKGQAFTGILADAKARGVIEPMNEWRNEKQRRNHGRPMRVWRSKVYAAKLSVEAREATK